MWFPWAPHISGTGHKPFSLPPPEPCGADFCWKSKSNPWTGVQSGIEKWRHLRFCKDWFWVGDREEEKDRETCFRQQRLANMRSFWRKQPAVWHQVPIREVNDQDQDLWGSLETFHPWMSLRIKKAASNPDPEKNREPAREKNVAILLIFGSLALASFETFYISMLYSAQFSHVILAFTSVH